MQIACDEDAEVRRMFAQALAKHGLEPRMTRCTKRNSPIAAEGGVCGEAAQGAEAFAFRSRRRLILFHRLHEPGEPRWDIRRS